MADDDVFARLAESDGADLVGYSQQNIGLNTVGQALNFIARGGQDRIVLTSEGISPSRGAAANTLAIQSILDFYISARRPIALEIVSGDPTPISEILYCCNDLEIYSKGGRGGLLNVTASETFAGSGRVLDLGNRNKADMNTEPQYECLPVAAGARQITLVTPSDTQMFEPGDVCWAQTGDLTGTLRSRLEYNIVVSVNAISGVVLMLWPFVRSVQGVSNTYLSKSSGTQFVNGRPRRNVLRPYIHDIWLGTTEPKAWVTSAGGPVQALFDNVYMSGRAGFFYNCTAKSIYRSCTAEYSDRWIEAADYSADVLHHNCTGIYVPRDIPVEGEPIIGYNGAVRNIQTVGGTVFGAGSNEARVLAMGWGSDCGVSDLTVYCQGLQSDLMIVSPTYGDCLNNQFRNIDVHHASPSLHIRVDPNPDAQCRSTLFEGIRFHGPQTANEAVRLGRANTGTVIRNIESEKGGFQVQQGTRGAVIDGIVACSSRHMSKVNTVTRTVSAATSNPGGAFRLIVTNHGFVSGDRALVRGAGAADGAWVVTAVSTDTLDLTGSIYVDQFTAGGTVQWESDAVITRLFDRSYADLFASEARFAPSAAGQIKSTSYVAFASTVIPANTLEIQDVYKISGGFLASGTAGEKVVAIRAGSVDIAVVTFLAGESGPCSFDIEMHVSSTAGTKFWTGRVIKGTVTSLIRMTTSYNSDLAPLQLSCLGRVGNTLDTVFTDGVRFESSRQYAN